MSRAEMVKLSEIMRGAIKLGVETPDAIDPIFGPLYVPNIKARRMLSESDPCSLCKEGRGEHSVTIGGGTCEIAWICSACRAACLNYKLSDKLRGDTPNG